MTRFAAGMCAGLLAALCGCASSQARRARAEALQRELEAFRYPKPLDEVWQEARLLLAQRGYPLAGADADAVGQPRTSLAERILSPARETSAGGSEGGLVQQLLGSAGSKPSGDVQSLDSGWNERGERYHLEGRKEGGGCRVIFTRLELDQADRRSKASRDLEMELDLARRVDPEGASRIEAALPSSGR